MKIQRNGWVVILAALGLLGLALGLYGQSAGQPTTLDERMKQVDSLFRAGDYERAAGLYAAALSLARQLNSSREREISQKHATAQRAYQLQLMADGYYDRKDYANAQKTYEELLELNPADTRAQKRKADSARLNRPAPSAPPARPEAAPARAASRTLAHDIEMVRVEGGTFMMGCTPEQGRDCDGDEKPPHEVTVGTYEIGKYEVTQAQWRAVMGANPSYFKGDNLPVERVSWEDVHEFISKLNELTGKKYRLPTEAEWEYAARGGNRSQGYKYSGSSDAGAVAWYIDNSGSRTHPVGQKQGNELGLYDMSGNVWEWVQDWEGDYSGGAQSNPRGPRNGSYRVVRGGSWISLAHGLQVSYRYWYEPGLRINFLGFRLARSSN